MDNAPDAPNLDQMISYRVSRLQSLLNRQAIAILKENGDLTPTQWRVLVMVNALERCTTAQIARATGLDKALLSRAVKGMIERGIIASAPSRANRSHQVLAMTRKGRQTFEAARPAMQDRHDTLLGCLTKDERDTLFRAFEKLELQLARSKEQTLPSENDAPRHS